MRKHTAYSNTCLQIPYDLKCQAKEQGINMSRVLVEGLERELKKGSARVPFATNTEAPALLSSTRKEVEE